MDPIQFITPGGRIVPWGGGEDVDIEVVSQTFDRVDGAWNRVHERKYSRGLVGMTFVLFIHAGTQPIHSGVKINKHPIHVDVKSFFREYFDILIEVQHC